MVSVYLPMGYPLITGEEFTNVLYQGNVVRLYVVPKDPRTDSQIFQRRFLSDVTRMRSMLCTWSKAMCKYALGSKWGTVIFQAIKADLNSRWSAALTEWDTFTEVQREAWRTNAPYQATFNDMGKMFFGLARVVYWSLEDWAGLGWTAALWDGDQSADARAWWDGTAAGQLKQGITQIEDDNPHVVGTWTTEVNADAFYGYLFQSINAADQSIEFAFFGKTIFVQHQQNSAGGTYDVYVDGAFHSNGTLYTSGAPYHTQGEFTLSKKAIHVVKHVRTSGILNIDGLEIL